MRRHLDSDGIERTPNQWGFNSFATEAGCLRSVQRLAKRGSTWFIWRLADGTYDYTATPEPQIPGHPAELVRKWSK